MAKNSQNSGRGKDQETTLKMTPARYLMKGGCQRPNAEFILRKIKINYLEILK